MKKKIAIATVLSSVALIVTGSILIGWQENPLQHGQAGAQNTLIGDSKASISSEGIFELKTSTHQPIRFLASNYTADGQGKLISLKTDGTIKNLDPIQNISSLTLTGTTNGESFTDSASDVFSLTQGYVENLETLQGVTMAKDPLTLKDSVTLNDSPSYVCLKALKDVDIDSLSIAYSCTSGGLHSEMPDKFKSFELTLVDSKVNFANGTSKLVLPYGTTLDATSFDTSKVSQGRSIVALQTKNGVVNLNKFSVTGKEDITPLFSPIEGYTRLTLHENVSSNDSSKLNGACTTGSFNVSPLYELNKGKIKVEGGEGGYPMVGNRISLNSPISVNSALRADMYEPNATTEAGVFDFKFNFENYSADELHLDVYVVNSSSVLKDLTYPQVSYRIDVDLLPGQSQNYTGQYKFDVNSGSNRMVYFVADKSMANVDFGYSVSDKLTELTEPTTPITPEVGTSSVNLLLPPGFVVNNYECSGTEGDPLVLPTQEQIVNNTGLELDGWVISGTNTKIGSDAKLLSDDITIHPLFKFANANMLKPCHGSQDRIGIDSVGGTAKKGDFKTSDTLTNLLMNGTRIKNDKTLVKGDLFRCLTKANPKIVANNTYKFNYSVTNNSASSIYLELIQVQGSLKITPEEGAITSGELEINPDQTVTFDIDIKLAGENDNIMPVFKVLSDISNLDITLAIGQGK